MVNKKSEMQYYAESEEKSMLKMPCSPVGLSLLCSKFHLLCFLEFLQFSAHYARFYASLDCIMLELL